jgi:anti-sigma28 factor (negative regulator of flagellin synthesis)
VKTVRQKQDEKREEKLEQIKRQVEDGSLVIRQMTDDERERHPAPAQPKPKRRR